ncbi:MAG: NUDIX hydrolase [Caulobacterales bacterium]|nr:NUDIX hydrolase [Caulobacterales bacterium]
MSGVVPIACAGVACFRGEEVLLVRRGRPPRADEWSIPGGKLRPGERAVDAALRELFEETGVRADLAGLIDVVDAVFRSTDGALERHYVLIDYAALWTAGEPRAGDDAADARFIPVEDALAMLAWDETRRIVRLAREMVEPNGADHSKRGRPERRPP